MNILGTGLTGLVGSRIVELLGGEYTFDNLSAGTGVDILDQDAVHKRIKNSPAPVVLHLAAKTDVDGCEKDKEKDIRMFGNKDVMKRENWLAEKTAWAVNVIGTQHVVEACRQTGKRLIYISTDFVFDGEAHSEYTEQDRPHPINWYGQTKYEGEKAVMTLESWTILRLAYPYRAHFSKPDFVRLILERLQSRQPIAMVVDHSSVPTFIDDVAQVFDRVVQKNADGIYHSVGSQTITPYDAAMRIAEIFRLDKKLITKTTRAEFFRDRAPRPFFLGLKNDRIIRLGCRMATFNEGLHKIKDQREKL